MGEPVPKGRPRVANRGPFPTIYTDPKTRAAEKAFQEQARKFVPAKPLEGPLKVTVKFFKEKPKSYSKTIVHWTKKPDLDNLLKLALDSMNKIFFIDDAQIVEIICSKHYDSSPRTEIFIEEAIL